MALSYSRLAKNCTPCAGLRFMVALLTLSLWLGAPAESADLAASPEVGSASTRAEQIYAVPLEGSAFYEKIGRRDLLETYQRRVQLKNGLKILGTLTTAVGLVLSVAVFTSNNDCPNPSRDFQCIGSGNFKNLQLAAGLIGVGLAAGGTGMLVAGFVINPDPVDAREARQLADEYNQKQTNPSGDRSEAEGAKRRAKVQISVAPLASKSGGGVALQLSF